MSDSVDLVLLGAGASAEAGVPLTHEMTERLVAAVQEGRPWTNHAQALNFVCGALLAHDAAGGASPYLGLDVERVFAAVQLLAERRTLEVTPFVSSWHPAVDAWDRARPPRLTDAEIGNHLLSDYSRSHSKVQEAIVKLIVAVTGPGEGSTYRTLSSMMLANLRTLLATNPGDADYLAPLIDAGRNVGGLTVATLNYDLTVEQVAQQRGVPVDTGIAHWSQHRNWAWSAEGVRLLKLHGSIDWEWFTPERSGGISHDSVRPSETDRNPPAVVFGGREKLRAEGPFLSLLAEFERQLTRARRLIVIGYGFRDDHINEIISRWTTENELNDILVVDPGFPEQFRGRDFRRALVGGMRPPLFQPDAFRTRLEIRRGPASQQLPLIFG